MTAPTSPTSSLAGAAILCCLVALVLMSGNRVMGADNSSDDAGTTVSARLSLDAILATTPGGETSPPPGVRETASALDWPRWDAAGAPFVFVQPAELRSPRPTPPAAGDDGIEELWARIDLDALQLRAFRRRGDVLEPSRPLMTAAGRAGGVPPGSALLVFANPYRRAAARVEISPASSGERLVFFLPPESTERFALPAGRYVFRREWWSVDRPEAVAAERHPAQEINPGLRYEATTESERDVMRRIQAQSSGFR